MRIEKTPDRKSMNFFYNSQVFSNRKKKFNFEKEEKYNLNQRD